MRKKYLKKERENTSLKEAKEKTRTKIDKSSLDALETLAEKNTFFLKGKVSQTSINGFKDYCLKTFNNSPQLPLVYFSFSLEGDCWSAEELNWYKERPLLAYRTNTFLQWLKSNYRPVCDVAFFYSPIEPYFCSWDIDQKVNAELSQLLESVPLLLPCNHPDLSWTKKAILIPDNYILDDAFHENIESLLKSNSVTTMSDVLTSSQKELALFSERESKIYFRGALSGPKLPFSLENIRENSRHYLLILLSSFSFLDVGITQFIDWKFGGFKGFYSEEYANFFNKNFEHLGSLRVDFFEHGKYKYLLSLDGFGAAWSRVQLIMATGSVLFLNSQCEQYFYSLLEKGKTHICINKDLSNLENEFNRLENDSELAQQIGANGREIARKFFTEDAINAYLTAVLKNIEAFGLQ